MDNDSGMLNDATIASKRKQVAREQKLEFVQLFKKYENKSRATKEFQPRYKVELNFQT